jgi:hypothetical protein
LALLVALEWHHQFLAHKFFMLVVVVVHLVQVPQMQ